MSCRCEDGRHIVKQKNKDQKLFENHGQLCSGMFHAKAWREVGITDRLCIHKDGPQKHHSVIYLIAVRKRNGARDLVVRFRNCFKGHSNINIHPEEFMIDYMDKKLIKGDRLIIYLKYQPCHHSCGSSDMRTHRKSCSQRIAAFAQKHPNVDIHIKCSSIHRANYTDPELFTSEKMRRVFSQRVEEARVGIDIVKKHVKLTGLDESDWKFIMSTTADNITISEEDWATRMALDKHVNIFLQNFSP